MTESDAPQAVVFDLDGLMFNTEELYIQVGSEVLRRRGKEISFELLDAMMGKRPRQAIDTMIRWHELNDTVDQIEEESREIFGPILDTQLAPMPGLIELLTALEAAGLPRAIATSSPRDFVESVFARIDLRNHFRFLLTAEDVTRGKPDPEIYETAAARFQLPTRALLVLEDSQNGCRAAVAANTQAVAVPAAHSAHHDFSGATLVINSLEDPQLYDLLGLPC